MIPLSLLGALTSPRAPFQQVDDEKTGKTGVFLSDCLLLPTILAQWHQPVASVVALDPLYQVMRAVFVPAHHHGHQNGQQVWCSFRCFFLACNPVVRRDDTEQILARWRRPVDSSEALDPLHWVMYRALHRRIIAAVETSCNGGVLFCIVDFDIDHNSR
jgi:hypothetical protein